MNESKDRAISDSFWALRVLRWLGPRSLLIWGLLFWAMGTVAYGMTETVHGLDRFFVLLVTGVAMTLGWLLALLPLPPRIGGLLSGLLGIEFLLVRVGALEDEILAIPMALFRAIWQITRLVLHSVVVWHWQPLPWEPWDAFWFTVFRLWTGFAVLVARSIGWARGALAGGVVTDPVASALIWGMLIWVLASWAGWVVRRYQDALTGIVPGGVLLAFILAYLGVKANPLLPLLGITFFLMGTLTYMTRERRWNQLHIDYSQDVWTDVLLVVALISVALVATSAVAPAISVKKIVEYVQELTEDQAEAGEGGIAQSLGLQPQPQPRAPTTMEQLGSTTLPRRHLIGSGPELSEEIAMVINTGEIPPRMSEFDPRVEVPLHYWRGLTYDIYFSRGWAISRAEPRFYAPGEAILDSATQAHTRWVRQTVRFMSYDQNVVHVAGLLVAVDQAHEVTWRGDTDLFGAILKEPVRGYRADSLEIQATADELRAASVAYPDWVAARYLPLPDDLPERLLILARDLTATEPTPYDRAVAIEQYLRQFPYTLNVPYPPVDRDIADYFIFDLKEGYCDYYATTMVVLARAAGIPARLAVGYATGAYDDINGAYTITEADAHAWPEIYFPGYGWVQFEPTAAYVLPNHELVEALPSLPDTAPALDPLVAPAPSVIVTWWPWLVGGIGGLALLVLGATAVDGALLLGMGSAQTMVAHLYRRVQWYSRRLNAPTRRGDTPYELETALNARLGEIAALRPRHFLVRRIPAQTATLIQQIIAAYVQSCYSPQPLAAPQRRVLVWQWWRLRWWLILARLWYRPPRMPGQTAHWRSHWPRE